MKITVNGKELTLDGALPLTLGDLRKLKTRNVPIAALNSTDPDLLHGLVLYLFQKANGDAVTEADVDALTVPQIGEISAYIANHGTGEADRPT